MSVEMVVLISRRLFIYLYICVVFVNACEQQQTCHDCIRQIKHCVWCASETFTGPRCISENSMPENWCPGELQNPNSTATATPHQLDDSTRGFVQIQPKKIDMNLRPGHTLNFDFSYTAAEHYPLDLYFLFDAFITPDLWKKQLEQTEKVIQGIQTVTSNISIGFGTFTNKNALPFTSIKNESVSYSFKHHFSISTDTEGFKKAMEEVDIVESMYVDNANGGFDALAQVIVCEEIGWRSISRKIVVFISDKRHQAAGDGIAAGIVNPYDGQCHMSNKKYTKELEMDYPSTYIINKLASEQKVTIIFVIHTANKYYEPLTKIINGARVIDPEVSIRNQKTVASELKNTYENITKEIKLNVHIEPNYEKKIKVMIEPDCVKEPCVVRQNKEQKFIGKITVLEYFEAEEVKVNISFIGIRETLILDIRLIRNCKCARGNNSICNGGGTLECGICKCNRNRSGINCKCSSVNVDANQNKSTCFVPNSKIECSGRGSCICGVCKCGEKRYGGRYCECDNEVCPKDKNGRLCGHGQCQCGECNCKSGWMKNSQRTCNCEASKDRCLTGEHECSAYGKCECNECKCFETLCEWDARSSQGPRCNPLPCNNCQERQCRLLEPYALGRSDSNKECGKRVSVTSVTKLDNETSGILCTDVRSNVGCYTKFLYKYDDEKYGVHLIVQSEHDCAESAYIYGGACLCGLILIGLLTLIGWKLLSTYRDRKEYIRFKRQHKESIKRAKEQMNPIFKTANTTINNPMHRKYSTMRDHE